MQYLGVVIKPHRVAEDHRPTRAERVAFRGSVSSCLGPRAHYDTYRLRRRLRLEGLPPWWLKAIRVEAGLRKAVLKKQAAARRALPGSPIRGRRLRAPPNPGGIAAGPS